MRSAARVVIPTAVMRVPPIIERRDRDSDERQYKRQRLQSHHEIVSCRSNKKKAAEMFPEEG